MGTVPPILSKKWYPVTAENDSDPRRIEPGLWEEIRFEPEDTQIRRALFLDRDGVLNVDTGYVGDLSHLKVCPHLAPLIRKANLNKIPVILTTNQSGIGRGYFNWSDFEAVNREIFNVLSKLDAKIDAVFACAYHPDANPPYNIDNHPWRKPNPGMLLRAATLFNIDLSTSLMIGDKTSDMEVARRAGLKQAIRISENCNDLPHSAMVPEVFTVKVKSLLATKWEEIKFP